MPETAERQIPEKQFISILKAHDAAAERTASINGEIGERIKHAQENANLNRPAYNFVRKLVRMEELKRKGFLACVEHYMVYCRNAGLLGNEHMGDLADMAAAPDQPDPEAEQRAADEAVGEENAEKLRAGIRPLDQAEQERLEGLFVDGQFAFLNGIGGVIPDLFAGDQKGGSSWLDGWRSAQLMSVEDREALRAKLPGESGEQPARETDADFDDATSGNPSMPADKKVSSRRKAAAVGDAAGSYDVRH